MNFSEPKSLEDMICNLLISGEKRTTALLSSIRELRKNTTKQGFYASLRKLKSEDVVIVYKSNVSLNTTWIKKMESIFEKINANYTVKQNSFNIFNLEDKESVSYNFSNIKNLDTFWGHSQNIIISNTNINQPIYCYDPHYWLYIAHKETESELLGEIVKNKRQFFMNVGNNDFLDRVIAKDFDNDYLQYNYKKIFDESSYYLTVIGDYITEVYMDKNTEEKINEVYKKCGVYDKNFVEKLKSFLALKVKSKIKISKNKNRAEKLKIKLGKDFYVR